MILKSKNKRLLKKYQSFTTDRKQRRIVKNATPKKTKSRTKSKQMPEALSRILTQEEQKKLISQFNARYFCGERNKLFVSLLLNTGLRLGESTNLKWQDVDFNVHALWVVGGKFGNNRRILLSKNLVAKLRHWQERQRSKIGTCEYVFTTSQGGKMGHRYLEYMVNSYSKKAGIQKRITPHILRHTFATHYLNYCKNVFEVQKVLGHMDLQSTMHYIHVQDSALENMRSFQETQEVKFK